MGTKVQLKNLAFPKCLGHHKPSASAFLMEIIILIISKDIIRLSLKRQEHFWIIKLEMCAPKGLNQE